MVDREVNPLEERHLTLSSRFKAAWAFHQLLAAMQRMNAVPHFENKSSVFQSLLTRLKELGRELHGLQVGPRDVGPQLASLEREVEELVHELRQQEQGIAPSSLRGFFGQIRNLDERVLIEIVRFLVDPATADSWDRDRLDKADFLLSRLAEKIAGPELRTDRSRLGKVLNVLSAVAGPVELSESELNRLIASLRELRSAVLEVASFEDLRQSGRVELYRALKHDLGVKLFHPRLLPLVVEVNGAFRQRIQQLQNQERQRILGEFEQLMEWNHGREPLTIEVRTQLEQLQERIDRFRETSLSTSIRLDELAELGRTLRTLAAGFEESGGISPRPTLVTERSPRLSARPAPPAPRSALTPDLRLLQPEWSELFEALPAPDPPETGPPQVAGPVPGFRLEPREISAYRQLATSGGEDRGADQFVLAAAAVRRRAQRMVQELHGLQSETPSSLPRTVLTAARDAARIADAYCRHYAHLVDQAVFDDDLEQARTLQGLSVRLQRELTELLRFLAECDVHRSAGRGPEVRLAEPAQR